MWMAWREWERKPEVVQRKGERGEGDWEWWRMQDALASWGQVVLRNSEPCLEQEARQTGEGRKSVQKRGSASRSWGREKCTKWHKMMKVRSQGALNVHKSRLTVHELLENLQNDVDFLFIPVLYTPPRVLVDSLWTPWTPQDSL